MNLINGEELDFKMPVTSNVSMTDDEINKKYIEGEIRIVTEQARYPLNTISSLISSDNYKLDPEYQRRHRWSNAKRSRLIESLIMNVPLPPIFLYEYDYSKYEVMDGLQRLTAISQFYEDMFTLEGLTKWPELNGKNYSTLPLQVKRGIDRRYISSIILLHETAKSKEEAEHLKQLVFDRINSGGEILTAQEKRNANYNGKLNKLCIKLSSNVNLCKTWGIPLPDIDQNGELLIPSQERIDNKLFKTMGDVELVLRFFAYRQRADLQKGSLETYLDIYLQYGNNFSDSVCIALEEIFNKTIQLAFDLFDEKAFYLYRVRKNNWSWYERSTTAVYDPLMYALSQNIDHQSILVSKKYDINQKMDEFYKENYEIFEGRNTNPAALIAREEVFKRFIESFL